MNFTIGLFFAGIWDLVWAWGIGIGLIILLCAAAYFSPVFKKDFLWGAFIVAVALFFTANGARLERNRVAAQEALIGQTVKTVVQGTATSQARGERDPYDSLHN